MEYKFNEFFENLKKYGIKYEINTNQNLEEHAIGLLSLISQINDNKKMTPLEKDDAINEIQGYYKQYMLNLKENPIPKIQEENRLSWRN